MYHSTVARLFKGLTKNISASTVRAAAAVPSSPSTTSVLKKASLRQPPAPLATAATAPSVEREHVSPAHPLQPPTAPLSAVRAAPRRKVVKKIIKKLRPAAASEAAVGAAGVGTRAPSEAARGASLRAGSRDGSEEAARGADLVSKSNAPAGSGRATSSKIISEKRLFTPPSTGEALRRELRGIPAPAEDASSGANTASAAASASRRKTSMVKAYKIEEVVSLCGPSDAIFARRLSAGGCQFFAWPGTPLSVASSAIISMPDTIRTVHAIFGRHNTPIDLVMDIDCPVPPEHWSMSKIVPYQRKVLDDVLTVVCAEIKKLGERIESQVVLQSPNLKKVSFHVHTKLKDVAFADYKSLEGFLASFRDRIPTVDLQIYRQNGMLRMFSCMKENHTSSMVVFHDSKWNIGFPGGEVSDEAAALHSIIVREAGTFSRVLHFDPVRVPNAIVDNGGDNCESEPRSVRVLLPRTEREAVENASRWLRQATEVEVSEWRSWIGLGLCAFRIGHHFRDAEMLRRPAMEEMLDAWVEASRHCSLKFKPGDCEQRWSTFDISKLGDHTNWWIAYQRLGRLKAVAHEHLLAPQGAAGDSPRRDDMQASRK